MAEAKRWHASTEQSRDMLHAVAVVVVVVASARRKGGRKKGRWWRHGTCGREGRGVRGARG